MDQEKLVAILWCTVAAIDYSACSDTVCLVLTLQTGGYGHQNRTNPWSNASHPQQPHKPHTEETGKTERHITWTPDHKAKTIGKRHR